MAMQQTVSKKPYATYSKEKTGDIIKFVQLEEGNLLSKSCNNKESGNEYDEDSNLAPLISNEEMDAMSSDNESDDENMYTDMLENIRDGIQYDLRINRREARYEISDCFKQRQSKLKKNIIINAKHG